MVLFCANIAFGQINYQTITPNEIEGFIEHGVRVTKRADQRRKLFDEVIASERQDLLAACFAYIGMGSEIREKVAKLPHNTYRLRAVITMLRTSSGFWPEDGTATRTIGGYDSASSGHLLVEPFISTMAELIPQEKLELHHMLSTKERIKLADRLEAALEKKTRATSTAQAVAPIPSSGPEVKQAPNVPQITPKAPLPQSVETTIEPDKEHESRSGLYLWLPIAVIAGMGLWIVIRKR